MAQMTSKQWLVLIRKDRLQEFQDSYAKMENISMIFLDTDGKPLTTWSNRPLICEGIPAEFKKRCIEFKHGILNKMHNNDFCIDTCFMDIVNFIVPVFFDNILVAYCFGGGVFFEKKENNSETLEKLHLKEIAEEKLQLIVKNISNVVKILNFDLSQIKKDESQTPPSSLLKLLSKREIDVVNGVCDGLSNKEIAKKLFISERTVKTHIYNIMGKLEVSNRLNLLLKCEKLKNGDVQ